MIKVTLLYGHPKDPLEFERYYAEKHLPVAAKRKGVGRLELTRFGVGPACQVITPATGPRIMRYTMRIR